MEVSWTDEQRQVIETRRRNILVSAAAGSGKTAVLVERILSRLCDAEDPVDIDELLIVTFTKAAAGEMRERLMRELLARRERQAGNHRLARQITLLPGAMITTIDGFCAYVVRNYGHRIGLVPGNRIAEGGEIVLMQQDALRDVLEAAYAEEDPAWRDRMVDFAETFASGKSERALEADILRIAATAESGPDPEGYLAACLSSAAPASPDALMETPWMREMMADAAEKIAEGYKYAGENLALARRPDGPSAYLPSALADYELFMALTEILKDGKCADAGAYEALRRKLQAYQAVMLSRKKALPGEDPALRVRFKMIREEVSAIRKALLEDFFAVPLETAAERIRKSARPIGTLLELVGRFRARFREIKQEKRVLDFSDLEHDALRILVEGGERTAAARELMERFREVMIDEYQDSNYLQEAILRAVSGGRGGEQNYFLVGDIKQSIYSFRDARPELFLKTRERYMQHGEEGLAIELHRNFRSRREVLSLVNAVFGQIMRREVGSVAYDESARLVAGAPYPETPGFDSEVLILTADEAGDEEAPFEKLSGADAKAMEARMIGRRIRSLIEEGQLYDAGTGRMRPVRYRDIVILLRTMDGWADVFGTVLKAMRIPVYSTARSGYFGTTEVTALLDYLSILDNPEQDIPFAAVLTSPFVSLGADALARIRTADLAVNPAGNKRREAVSLHEAARAYAEDSGEHTDYALKNTLEDFFRLYDSLREGLPDTPLHETIERLLFESGFRDYVSALPGGAQRALNLSMLVDKAVEYEKTSYIGLFHFIRYIENLKKYSQDFGELSTIQETDDVVRIYSVHKSKGLEFPIVFAAGLGKKYNLQDLNADPLVHPDLGVASSYLDYKRRTKAPTLFRQAVRRRMAKEVLGEELRVLYVALTRAREKLIMTGTYPGEEKLAALMARFPKDEEALPAAYIAEARSALQLLLPAVQRIAEGTAGRREGARAAMRWISPKELLGEEAEASLLREDRLLALKQLRQDTVYDAAVRQAAAERFAYVYPHALSQIPVEMSVSELKAEALRGTAGALADGSGETRAEALYAEAPVSPLIPDFYRGEAAGKDAAAGREMGRAADAPLTGPERGTAYHRVFELLPFAAFRGLGEEALLAAAGEALRRMEESGKLRREEAAAVSPRDIAALAGSALGQRMGLAAREGCLMREQPFVLMRSASDIRAEWPEDEQVFVQGIIDAYFETEEGLVLIDYKTDRVRGGDELVRRYRVQLMSYAEALVRLTARPVREILIWSVALGREIPLGGFNLAPQ